MLHEDTSIGHDTRTNSELPRKTIVIVRRNGYREEKAKERNGSIPCRLKETELGASSGESNKIVPHWIGGWEKESNNLLLLDFTRAPLRLLSFPGEIWMGIKFVPTCDHFPSLSLTLAQKGFFMTGFFLSV